MVGRRSFPFGAGPIFRGELLVSGRVYDFMILHPQKFIMSAEKDNFKGKVVFQLSFLRGYVCFLGSS